MFYILYILVMLAQSSAILLFPRTRAGAGILASVLHVNCERSQQSDANPRLSSVRAAAGPDTQLHRAAAAALATFLSMAIHDTPRQAGLCIVYTLELATDRQWNNEQTHTHARTLLYRRQLYPV